MKKISSFILLIFLISSVTSTFSSKAVDAPSVSAHNAVVIDMDTLDVLYDKRMHEAESIASITKILTAYLALEYADINDPVEISREATLTEGSSIYAKEDDIYILEDLVYGLMLRSGNDAAVAIAEHVGGSIGGFSYLMNETANWIGMENSQFQNPHGLEEEGHYSTAYDMALLTAHAMKHNDKFKEVFGTEKYLPQNIDYYWFNKNKLLMSYEQYCTGGKTGFTKKAGRTLVTTAESNGHEIVVVTLNAPDDWNDHKKLYDYAFHILEDRPNLPIQAEATQLSLLDIYYDVFLRLQGSSAW